MSFQKEIIQNVLKNIEEKKKAAAEKTKETLTLPKVNVRSAATYNPFFPSDNPPKVLPKRESSAQRVNAPKASPKAQAPKPSPKAQAPKAAPKTVKPEPKMQAAKPVPAVSKTSGQKPSPPVSGKTTPKATPGNTVYPKKNADDYECPICLQFCAQPVVTSCKHFFCYECSKEVQKMGMTCPLCRVEFDRLFIPTVDKNMQNEIMANCGQEFEERKGQLVKDGAWRGDKVAIKFAFGNTHSDVPNARKGNPNAERVNDHRWTMFLSVNGNNVDLTSKYVKQVKYTLHETFAQPVIVVKEAPFLLARVGWGWFTVKIEVTFRPETGIPNQKLQHELCFDGNGKTQNFVIELDENSQDETSAEIGKLMQKICVKEKPTKK